MTKLPVLTPEQFKARSQCEKKAWTERFAPDRISEDAADMLMWARIGRSVRDLAREQFQEALEVPSDALSAAEAQIETRALLQTGLPIINGTFGGEASYQVPVLEPLGDGSYRLVTSSISRSPDSLTRERAGYLAYRLTTEEDVPVRVVRIMSPDPETPVPANGPDASFFRQTDLRFGDMEPSSEMPNDDGFRDRMLDLWRMERTDPGERTLDEEGVPLEDLASLMHMIRIKLRSFQEPLQADDEPDVQMGPHCNVGHGCPIKDHCKSLLPEDTVRLLHHSTARSLMKDGIDRLGMIPPERKIPANAQRIVDAVRTGQAQVDYGSLADLGNLLRDGAHIIDFETATPPLPPVAGLKPYEWIGFQWNMHTVTPRGIEEIGYLGIEPGTDPSEQFMATLAHHLRGSNLPIVIFSSHEKTTTRNLSERYPEFQGFHAEFSDRTFDLLKVVRSNIYMKEFRGAFGLKVIGGPLLREIEAGLDGQDSIFPHLGSLTPTTRGEFLQIINEAGYEHLTIGNGGVALASWLKAMDPETSEEEREDIAGALIKYVSQDTLQPMLITAGMFPQMSEVLEKAVQHDLRSRSPQRPR